MAEEVLKKGIGRIFYANIINLVFNIATGFLLPQYLSVESYAQIKTYQLYLMYGSLLHLGYIDGMYLKYGGKTIEEISGASIENSISTLRIFQLVMVLCGVLVAVQFGDIPLLMASIAVLPSNIIGYFRNFYQAVGEFKRYSKIMNLTTGLTFAVNIFLIAVVRLDNYVVYLAGYIALNVVLWLILEKDLHGLKRININLFCFSFRELKENISSGILMVLGYFSSQILTSMDRLFVKFLVGNVAFAQYAFAVSMENFLNVAVSPISLTLYNYFCRNKDNTEVKKITELIIALSTVVIAAAFPLKFILEIFLKKYLNSTSVIFLLFASQIFYIIIKSVYVNLYKAYKMQIKYFSKLCAILVIAFLFNVICYIVYPLKEAFAVGTLLSAIAWFILCQFDFRELKYTAWHYIYITAEVLGFLFFGITFKAIPGGLLYLAFTAVMLAICMPKTLHKALELVKMILKK